MFRKRHPPAGSAPGELVCPEQAAPPQIHIIEYNADEVRERDVTDIADLGINLESQKITWVNVRGLGDEAVLRKIGELFSLHPLVLADIVNVPQRPKVDVYEGHELLIARAVFLDEPMELRAEQVSIVLGANYVLTFQEHHDDTLEAVANRIRRGGQLRRMGADLLAQAILDAVIDGYYPVLEQLGEYLEDLEDDVVQRPTPRTLNRVHDIKRELLVLRRTIWPQRDAVNAILRGESELVAESTLLYFRDCYDHAAQVVDVLEVYREIATSLMEVYLSSVSNRMNEVMKVLTIMASIFIPLTFIVGIYGMNFQYMPELHKRWAYPTVWLLMLAIAFGMVVYFHRRGWLGSENDRGDDDEAR